jgi:hypothetical protein
MLPRRGIAHGSPLSYRGERFLGGILAVGARAPILAFTVYFTFYPLALTAQYSIPSAKHFSHAIAMAAEYLERNCDPSGQFAYLVDTDSGDVSPSYNIARHAGAIYSLAMLNQVRHDSNVANVMVRASNFMRTNYVALDAVLMRSLSGRGRRLQLGKLNSERRGWASGSLRSGSSAAECSPTRSAGGLGKIRALPAEAGWELLF